MHHTVCMNAPEMEFSLTSTECFLQTRLEEREENIYISCNRLPLIQGFPASVTVH